jgi:HAUS augmin-like complex subunit 1
VNAWLEKKYGKRIPPFERNEETLPALLSLATLNEDADDQSALVEKIERQALQSYARRQIDGHEIQHGLLRAISAERQRTLDALASSAVMLNSLDMSTMAASISRVTSDHFQLSEQAKRLQFQGAILRNEQVRCQVVLQELKGDAFTTPDNFADQSAEWSRNTKQLKAKLAEYDERLVTLRSTSNPGPSFQDIERQLSDVQSQDARLSELNAQLAGYDSLPSDAQAARNKLEAARSELRELMLRRDKLFEGLVGG